MPDPDRPESSTQSMPVDTYAVLVGDTLVGYSNLASGDPPMGVACGDFHSLPGYDKVQHQCIAARDDVSQAHLHLSIRLPNGRTLPAVGVCIFDYSPELGSSAIEVHALGIPYPLYGELFPAQVEAYARQFPPQNATDLQPRDIDSNPPGQHSGPGKQQD